MYKKESTFGHSFAGVSAHSDLHCSVAAALSILPLGSNADTLQLASRTLQLAKTPCNQYKRQRKRKVQNESIHDLDRLRGKKRANVEMELGAAAAQQGLLTTIFLDSRTFWISCGFRDLRSAYWCSIFQQEMSWTLAA